MPLGVILLLCSFSRTKVFGFLQGPWFIESQVLGLPSSTKHGFHFMDWSLSLVKQWLVISTMFVLLLYQHVTQAGHLYKLQSL